MKATSQLHRLIDLKIPFAILFTNSYLGSDSFVIALASDCKQQGLNWEESYSQPLLLESALTAADLETFSELRRQDELQTLPLGEDGMAYELLENPFRPYYKRAAKRRLSDKTELDGPLAFANQD